MSGPAVPTRVVARRPARLGSLVLGDGGTAVAVATTGPTVADAVVHAQAAEAAGADLVELRLDLLEELVAVIGDPAALRESALTACTAVAAAIETPLLATVRTESEGGGAALDGAPYRELLAGLARSGAPIAGIDVELARGCVRDIATAAHAAGIAVIGSSHDFEATPPDDEILSRLRAMEAEGADAAKIAVMPASDTDVVRLLGVTRRAAVELRIPVIAMSMGERGALTRLLGPWSGSALTFATAGGDASAPGQLRIDDVRRGLASLSAGGGR